MKRNTPRTGGRKRTETPSEEPALLAKVAAMPDPFRSMGVKVHTLIMRSVPALRPTLWYGMPAYARDGKAVCFFRADKKYMTFGITQEANLEPDAGAAHQLVEAAWYFSTLDEATEGRLAAIVRRLAP